MVGPMTWSHPRPNGFPTALRGQWLDARTLSLEGGSGGGTDRTAYRVTFGGDHIEVVLLSLLYGDTTTIRGVARR